MSENSTPVADVIERWTEFLKNPAEADIMALYAHATEQGLDFFQVEAARSTARLALGREKIRDRRNAGLPVTWNYARHGFPYYDRNELPAVLMHLWQEDAMTPEELAKGLEDAWTSAEWPEVQEFSCDWADVFEFVGFLENAKQAPSKQPTKPLTVYRGATAERAKGMSWTDNPAKALWFAKRFVTQTSSTETSVYELVVDPVDLYAHFTTGRGEDEWVLNPYSLDSYYEPFGHDLAEAEARWGTPATTR